MTASAVPAPPMVAAPAAMDAAFIAAVLTPYRPDCRYLRSAEWEVADSAQGGVLIRGEFSIGESCYIADTGHFNAVEFNICYNQLAYVHLARCIAERRLPALDSFDPVRFQQLQLSHFLIAAITSRYRAPINPRRFRGEVSVVSARRGPKFSLLETSCRFFDGGEGRSEGEVKLVVLHPAAEPSRPAAPVALPATGTRAPSPD